MTDKQRLKHITDRQPQPLTEGSSLDAAEPTPDGLGEWQGGPVALKCVNNDWVSRKSRANALAARKEAVSKLPHVL